MATPLQITKGKKLDIDTLDRKLTQWADKFYISPYTTRKDSALMILILQEAEAATIEAHLREEYATILQNLKKKGNRRMATFQFITGELVTVEADNLEEAEELLALGDYTFQETISEYRPSSAPCPNHEGNYDCTPFCSKCYGEQELPAIRRQGENR